MQVLYGIGDTRKGRREYLKIRHSKRSRTALADAENTDFDELVFIHSLMISIWIT